MYFCQAFQSILKLKLCRHACQHQYQIILIYRRGKIMPTTPLQINDHFRYFWKAGLKNWNRSKRLNIDTYFTSYSFPFPSAPLVLPMLEPNQSCSIPLPHTNWQMYVRPHGWGVGFCHRPIPWQTVERPKAMKAEPMECKAQGSYDEGIFRWVVDVYLNLNMHDIFSSLVAEKWLNYRQNIS